MGSLLLTDDPTEMMCCRCCCDKRKWQYQRTKRPWRGTSVSSSSNVCCALMSTRIPNCCPVRTPTVCDAWKFSELTAFQVGTLCNNRYRLRPRRMHVMRTSAVRHPVAPASVSQSLRSQKRLNGLRSSLGWRHPERSHPTRRGKGCSTTLPLSNY